MSTDDTLLPDLLGRASHRSATIGSNLSLHHSWRDGRLVVHISGSASDVLPEQFTQAVTNLFAHLRPTHAAIDLSACQSLPSVVLAFLVFYQKTATDHGGRKTVLYGANPRILTVIKMIGMLDFFVIKPDEAAMKAWCVDTPA